MPMTPQQVKTAQKWFAKHLGKIEQRRCSECQEIGTQVGFIPHVLLMPDLGDVSPSGIGLGNHPVPVIGLTCTKCGHMSMFNAINMGVVPGTPATPISITNGHS
jgi:hypothetical protein